MNESKHHPAEHGLRDAARELLAIRDRCPALFEHVLPIDAEDIATLVELAEFEDC